jgi:PKD repeat protein
MCLVGGVVANTPTTLNIAATQNSITPPSNTWVIVTHQLTIGVTAVDSNGFNPSGVPVSFSLTPNSVVLGTLSLSSVLTNSNGMASTTFTANKTSGTATINIALTYNNTVTNFTLPLQIDHDVPYYWTVTSPSQGTVGTDTYFNVSYTDQWGNVIDHRNPADPNTISLDIGSVSGKGAFNVSGNLVTSTSQQLDQNGNLSVDVMLDQQTGQNNIHIYPFYPSSQGGAIPDVYPSIIGIANGVPVSITQSASPNPPIVKADMAQQISMQYTLYDKYGNPTVGQNISVQSSVGDSYPGLPSNGFGQVGLTYGPSGIARNITLTATADANSSVTCSENVTFYSTSPVNWALSADPQTMASLDVNPSSSANITGQVMDVYGNPVAGQTVTFQLGNASYDLPTDNKTAYPTLSSNSATTDSNGNAIVQFTPGGFSNATLTPYYNPSATGNCSVIATWNGTQQSVLLTWKNYPYLSAYTSVSPPMVNINGTVNVTIKLTGDGWALQPNPIDVVLLMDRSGSMSDCLNQEVCTGYGWFQQCTCPGGTELANAKIGATSFVNLINESNDRTALVSFSGNPPTIDTTFDQNLTTNANSTISAISNLQATSSTGTRDGLYKAIMELIQHPNPNPKAVRAVILLTDGDYNWLGDYLGRGTGYPPPPNSNQYSNTINGSPDNYQQTYLYYGGLTSTTYSPTAYFTATNGSSNYQAVFTDASTGSPTSWSWTFGDGSTSTSQSPSHTYSTAGTYPVSETVTNSAGSNTYTATVTISITTPVSKSSTATTTSPTAYFTSTQSGLTATFRDASTGGPTSYSWSFGDGSAISTTKSPSHTYSTAGTYTVTETVTNSAGSNTCSATVTVAISASVTSPSTATNSPSAKYTATSSGLTATFTDGSTFPSGGGTKVYGWVYGDGNTANGTPVGHTYPTGTSKTYTVTETVCNNYGCNNANTGTVKVANSGGYKITQITSPSTATTNSPSAYFTATSSGLTVTFTDGSTFPSGGGTKTYSWVYGDGNTATGTPVSHTYSSAGTYTVTETVSNSYGYNIASTTVTVAASISGITSPGTTTNPTASFTAAATSTNYQVQFTDTSSGTPTSWSWAFGDGGTSTLKSPTYTYSTAGTYPVTETVTNSAGNSNIYTATVTVSGPITTVSISSPGPTPTPTPTPPTSYPDGQLTQQNLSVLALNNNIRVYTIGYAASSNFNAQSVTDMNVLANATGGFYAPAPNAATLALIYTEIAGNLQTAAGVNTTMNLNFQNVNLTGVTVPGAQALSYVPNTTITWQDGVTNSTDQSSQWNAPYPFNQQLSFNVGTINLGQTWQATFMLMVKQAGSIQLFGNGSTVTFNNGASYLTIPPVFITVNPNLTVGYGPNGNIVLTDFGVAPGVSGDITEFLPLQWNTYLPDNTVPSARERLYYSTTDLQPQTCGQSPWVEFDDQQTGIPPGESNEYSTLDVRNLPAGTYYICVLAQDPSGSAGQAIAETTNGIQVKTSGKSYIKLQ